MPHTPVLYQEVLRYLQPHAGGLYLDGTLGAGGHTAGILTLSAPDGRVLALDRDPDAIMFAKQRLASFGDRVTYLNANYADMTQLAPAHGFSELDGILLDLGLSSRQLDDAQRGFSFMKDGPLDMRFDPKEEKTAADLVNRLDEADLADIFWRYGEERQSRRYARAIVAQRPLHTTRQLANLIATQSQRRGRLHPATKVFQALRIATNQELEAVEAGVQGAMALLKQRGRLVVISFHSLEDRIVKRLFRRSSKGCVCPEEQPVCTCDANAAFRLINRKAVKATAAEIESNPRSRSARLRAIEKLGNSVL